MIYARAIWTLGTLTLLAGCGNDTANTTSRVVAAQQMAVVQLQRYQATGDWKKRLAIRDASGLNELVASRIFRAFDVVAIGKKPFDDERFVEAAWDELFANTEMTLAVLHPIVRECVATGERMRMSEMSTPPVSENNLATFFFICRRIAAFEVRSNALQVLTECAASSDTRVAHAAQENLALAVQGNWRAKRAIYDRTKSVEVLQWFADNVLRRGLTRKDVHDYLGEGRDTLSFHLEYVGRRNEQEMVLSLQFFDDYLAEWQIRSAAAGN